jgi:hypothetical protein
MKAKASVVLLTATALMLTASCAFADAAADIACFTSESATPIHFEMRTYYDRDIKFAFASIKYAKAKAAIPVVLQSDAAESRGGGQADEVTTTWLEVVGGAVRGSYKMVHQGANVDSMTYTNFKTKKTVLFLLDTHVDSTLEKGCAWER